MKNQEGVRRHLSVNAEEYEYFSLAALPALGFESVDRLPLCLRVLAENILRHIGHNDVEAADLQRLLAWEPAGVETIEVPFHPARVLLQDYAGLPTLVDLAALRDGLAALGLEPERVSPQIPVDLVVDHSLIIDQAGHAGALAYNQHREFERNEERYRLAKWATASLGKMRVVPPGNGIMHQINIEYLANIVQCKPDGKRKMAFLDTMVGTDSHSTMVNGIGVLGWGVGGIEAEAAMLGLPLVVPLRRVIGVRVVGQRRPGVTSTDLVLTLTQKLRAFKVVDTLVEFFGPALESLAVTDRVTIANMAPEYGSTSAFFPIDEATLRYLEMTGRSPQQIALVEAYAKAQKLWRSQEMSTPDYSAVLEFDLGDVEPCVSGPRRPQDRVPLSGVVDNFEKAFSLPGSGVDARNEITDGAVVIAAITGCTNTSNPAVMFAAGLLARNAHALGLRSKPWVKTSLTPGSRVVGAYLAESGLQSDLDALGFQIAGYGCATCGGNSGRLDPAVEHIVLEKGITACAVLSGNRNFEARIHPLAKANYLMSPPLVIAYALAGTVTIDLTAEPIGYGHDGRAVFLKDIWPSESEIEALMRERLSAALFQRLYADVFKGGAEEWAKLTTTSSPRFPWDPASTYIRQPPYLADYEREVKPVPDLLGARALLVLGDGITTDHISPVGDIAVDSPAGHFLHEHGVAAADFNAYGARRSNHEVMVRGTFANIRLRNELVPGVEGGFTRHFPDGAVLPVYDAAQLYAAENVPLVVVAGREYGTGSSRDWAARGTRLLGVRVVIAESFERIHRSNLIMMGVLPLEFLPGVTRLTLGIDGTTLFDMTDLAAQVSPGGEAMLTLRRADGSKEQVRVRCRIDTLNEFKVWSAGGMLPFVLGKLSADSEHPEK